MNTEAWAKAGRKAFEAVLAKVGGQEGRDAFLDYLPPVFDAWMLTIGGGGDVRNTWTGPITELHMEGALEGQFRSNAAAKTWALKALDALPVRDEAPLTLLRLGDGGMPEIGAEEVEIANVGGTILWVVTMKLEAVVATA